MFCAFMQAKLKKMKEKYADQDDDERHARMEILAVRTWESIQFIILYCLPLPPSLPPSLLSLSLQSAGAMKERKDKKDKKGKKNKKDPLATSNPKQKYHPKEKARNQLRLADTEHKQKAPLFLPVAADLAGKQRVSNPVDQEDHPSHVVISQPESLAAGQGLERTCDGASVAEFSSAKVTQTGDALEKSEYSPPLPATKVSASPAANSSTSPAPHVETCTSPEPHLVSLAPHLEASTPPVPHPETAPGLFSDSLPSSAKPDIVVHTELTVGDALSLVGSTGSMTSMEHQLEQEAERRTGKQELEDEEKGQEEGAEGDEEEGRKEVAGREEGRGAEEDGMGSDEEEKKALLEEEDIQLLEEHDRV